MSNSLNNLLSLADKNLRLLTSYCDLYTSAKAPYIKLHLCLSIPSTLKTLKMLKITLGVDSVY